MTTRLKLTEKAIDKLRAPDPSGKPKIHWDSELRGFGVLCSGTTNRRAYVAQRDMPGGKSRRVTVAGVGEVKLATARERAAAVLDGLRRGIDPKARPQEELTLRRALDDYLERNKRLRPTSRRHYLGMAERHLAAWLDRPLATITREMVEARHRQIAEEVAAGGRYKGEVAANNALRVLRLVWADALDRDATLPPNPVRLRKAWYDEPRRTRLVKADELPAFYEAVLALEDPVQRDLVLLLLFTGMRKGEAAGLRWGEVDFAARLIRIPAERTKSGRPLDLPMSSFVRDLLVARRAVGDAGFVFPGRTGHVQDPRPALAAVAAATGTYVSAHDLRRTYITVAESTDISLMALKALVNHANGDVTGGYVMMTPERLREPAQAVCDRMLALCGVVPPAGVERIA